MAFGTLSTPQFNKSMPNKIGGAMPLPRKVGPSAGGTGMMPLPRKIGPSPMPMTPMPGKIGM
jgi:hypothetical protein